MGIGSSSFSVGDKVVVSVTDEDTLLQMQAEHGGWNSTMKECFIGPCVILRGMKDDAIIQAPSGAIYRLNINLLSPYEGDDAVKMATEASKCVEVTVINDLEKIRRYQKDHGGCPDSIQEFIGQIVTVVKKYDNNEYEVKFGDKTIRLHGNCLSYRDISTGKVSTFSVNKKDKKKLINDLIQFKALQDGHGGWSTVMSLMAGTEVEVVDVDDDGDCMIEGMGMTWLINPQCFQDYAEHEYFNNTQSSVQDENVNFKIGEHVKVITDINRSRQLQYGHGGWVEGMERFLGQIGVVKSILPTGDVKVKIGAIGFVFNPKMLIKQDKAEANDDTGQLKKGDVVKIISNKKKVQELQVGHGEWVDSMSLCLGEKGKVKYIFPDGDIRIKLMGVSITVNPKCVEKVESAKSDDDDGDEDDDDEDDEAKKMLKMMMKMAKMFGSIIGEDDDNDDDSPGIAIQETSNLLGIGDMDEPKRNFLMAVKQGDVETCKKWIGVLTPELTLPNNLTPLHIAVNEGHSEIVQLIIPYIDLDQIDAQDSDGDTALYLAVCKNNIQIVRQLMHCGSNPTIINKKKTSALHVACYKGFLDILKELTTYPNIDFSIGDTDGDTCLHLAIQKERHEVIKFLLEKGADINTLNEKKFNVFFLSVLRGDHKSLRLILEKAGSKIVDSRKDDHFSALHVAAINNHVECIRVLNDFKADLNIRNNQKQTPLHLAVSQRYLNCVKELVKLGADVNLKDNGGDTPLHDILRLYSRSKLGALGDMMGLLENFGPQRDTPKDIALYLVRNNAKLNIKNNEQKDCLSFCIDTNFRQELINIKSGPNPAYVNIEENKKIIDKEPEEMEELKKKIEKMKEDKVCVICYDRPKNTAFQCGHLSCEICAENLYECHICRTPVEERIKIFNN